MRIIGGEKRGLKLADVGMGDQAAHLRPTSDRVREAIFNLLINGPYGNPVQDARVLDLFAGTGALGLEAVSRGAARVAFVDDGTAAYDLVFLDPPYGKALGEAALASCVEGGWLAPGAMIVWEESSAPILPDGFEKLDQRKYGDTIITIARAPE